MIIGNADLTTADSSVEASATPESSSLAFLEIWGYGEISDGFDYLEIDGRGAWYPDRPAGSLARGLDDPTRPRFDDPTRTAPAAANAGQYLPGVHRDRLRHALAHLPAPVTLVTCADQNDTPIGATVSAFSSLSLDPPLVVLSLDRRSRTLEAIRARRAFAVHVLGDGHRPLAMRFAERRGDKFHELEFARSERGVPLLEQYSFRFECLLHDEFPGGDHALVIGAVEEVSEHDVSQDPVVWYARGFQRLSGE